MKNPLLRFLVVWLVVGAFISPGLHTNDVVQHAFAKQNAKVVVKELTDVSLIANNEVLFCFFGKFGDDKGIYAFQLNVQALLDGKEIAGVIADEVAHELGKNVYEVSYKHVRRDCPNVKRIKPLAFAMYSPREGRYSMPYNSIMPPDGKDEGVYGVDLKYLPSELVLTGKLAGDKTHIALRFSSKPMPQKKYYLFLWPFAFLLDSLLFPVEWIQVANFKG